MRERTTWTRNANGRTAAHMKQADPATMNAPEHMQAQPSADAYANGDPSKWGEDVTSPNTWEEEYSGGAVKRDEIGMPQYRSETFNHSEKTAAMDEEVLLKKSSLCVRTARLMLPRTASESLVEDQAVSLMHLPHNELIETFGRLASEQEEEETEEKPAQDQGQQKQAQEQAQEQEQAEEAQTQQKQANDAQSAVAAAMQALQAGDQAGAEKALQAALQSAMGTQACDACNPVAQQQMPVMAAIQKAANDILQQMAQQLPAQVAQQQAPQAPAQVAQQQVPPQVAQQQVPPQVAQQQQAPAPTANDIDTMLAEETQMAPVADFPIEMEAPSMDIGETVLGPDDDVLQAIFASQDGAAPEEKEQAAQQQQNKQANVRTASTIGTRPQGVSRIGGAPAPRAGGEIDKLTNIWNSAPDVREAFGMK